MGGGVHWPGRTGEAGELEDAYALDGKHGKTSGFYLAFLSVDSKLSRTLDEGCALWQG